jgi:hypothetical protein
MDDSKLRQIIQQEIQTFMRNGQFNLTKIQQHEHNGTDTVNIPISSISSSFPIQGSNGGVFDPTILNGQKVNLEYTTLKKNPNTVYVLPVNIIYGFGVGVDSAFNGGVASPGTMVFLENSTLSTLWINTINGWRGVNFNLQM